MNIIKRAKVVFISYLFNLLDIDISTSLLDYNRVQLNYCTLVERITPGCHFLSISVYLIRYVQYFCTKVHVDAKN